MDDSPLSANSGWRIAGFYLAVLGGGVAMFLAVLRIGERTLTSSAEVAVGDRGMSAPIDVLLHVLLALAVVMVATRVLGWLFSLLGQPPVIGEVVGGILLGPSFLGYFAPAAYEFLLPAWAAPFLGVISQLGIILYMFLVGVHLDLRILRRSGQATLAISHASIIIPFTLGTVLALGLYSRMAPAGVSFTAFALFMGVSMSVTAFPVLARILSDSGLHKTRLGVLALTCAAIDDVTAWCLLAFVVSVTQATFADAFVTLGLTVVYIIFMLTVVRSLVMRLLPSLESAERIDERTLAVIFVALLLSALATEFIGIHAIFGGFLLGAVTPHDSRLARDITERLEGLVRVMFLPAFFAFTGMRTEIGLLQGGSDWLLCALIIAAATAGKFGGTLLAARFVGLHWLDSAALGILMNTRGLVELIVLNIGLDLGVITPRLFTMLVVMALATTILTAPVLQWLLRRHPPMAEP